MKRSKSGAQKRKEAATARDAVAKLPKMTDFFKITEQSRPGTSTERDEENYSVQEKEDYDDQHQSDCEFPENVSCDLPANTQPSISKITESQFTPIPDDPCKWPESISDETKSLIAHLSKWSFLLSVFIWYDILFQVNKASKILQSYGVSLHTMETEIQATEKFLQNYRTTGYDSAATSAVEIAQELDIDPSFPPSRSGKKRRLFDYQGEEEQRATPELKFKSNFFYPLVDQAIMSIKERFNLLREVSSAFSFLYTRDKLLLVQQENALLTCCKEFQKKFGDIDSDEMSAELQRFVLILQKKRNLKTAQDFLNYLLKTHLFELYPNVYIALRILLTCPVTVASAERSFSKLKLIKTFNRTSMTDSRPSSLAMLSIENDCARSLDYDNVITAFANKKVRSRLFK